MDSPAVAVDPILLAIVGPTGSGKSALALDVAARFEGEIVNCDSLQLYRGFDVGTAKTLVSERRGIPHHLFDVLSAQDGYSSGEYGRRARAVVREISSRGRLPVVVGGTGFYLKALLEGLPPLPQRDTELREGLAGREARREGSLHRLLRRLDAQAAAGIHANDVHKLIRALEVRILTRRERAAAGGSDPLMGFRVIKLGLDPDRTALAARLDARTLRMFEGGLIEEVLGLLAAGCTGVEKPFESLGYRQAVAVVRREMTLEAAVMATQSETRQYAKRQRTWFRRDKEVRWLQGFGEAAVGQVQDLSRVLTTTGHGPVPSSDGTPHLH